MHIEHVTKSSSHTLLDQNSYPRVVETVVFAKYHKDKQKHNLDCGRLYCWTENKKINEQVAEVSRNFLKIFRIVDV